MPRFTPAPSPKCPRCGDSIFATELKLGPNGTPYHARCLTCRLCNKRLDSTLLVEHDGDAYCKHCHAKLLGTGANGFTRAVPLQPRSPEAAGVRVGAFASPHSPSAAGSPVGLVGSSVGGGAGRAVSASPSAHRATSSVSSVASSSRGGAGSSLASSTADTTSRLPPPAQRTAAVPAPSSIQRAPVVTAPSFSRPGGASPPKPAAGIRSDPDYDPEFGPTPVPSSRQPAQSMDDLVNQVTNITIRPRGVGVGVMPAPPIAEFAAEPSRPPAAAASAAEDADEAESVTSLDAASHVGTVGTPGLPPPRRQQPSKHGPAGPAYKTAPAYGGGTSGVSRLGLASSISAAAGGTPLCARCAKPVYFAEQKQGAGRKWHRACLRCDGCSTILESGRLEEGPANGAELAATINPQGGHGANVWCRTCYAKHFGPKGIGVGLSVPESLTR